MRHVTELQVRYAETDQMGVVYHAHYLVWCEVGRTDFIRALGMPYAEMERQGIRLAVADATVRYHAGARYDDRIAVETRLVDVRSRMVTFAYRILRRFDEDATELLVSARIALVCTGREGRPASLPPSWRALLDRGVSAD
ncbi:MAG: acyl-CoA thioesterase [Gemmatimonadetes bacterium]|nr:acyl-CoA thioesterase [Gemmatimonadota bacterium]